MKKQKRSAKKMRFPPFFEDLQKAALEKAANIAVIAVFLAVAFFLMNAFIQKSDYFDIKCADVKGISDAATSASLSAELLKSYKGRNIFGTDIRSISRQLQAKYPDAKDVFVLRTMPNKLTVIFIFRRPAALLVNGRYYAVDGEGFLVLNADAKQLAGLPSIYGVGVRYDERNGRKVESRNLKCALELLDAIHGAKFMAKHPVVRIDAGDVKAMAFYLDDGLEVRIGNENLKERLALLRRTLRDPRLLRDRIKYIDLRFDKDAVIGPK